MGGASSCMSANPYSDLSATFESGSTAVQWHIWPSFDEAKREFSDDPVMPPFERSSQVELRNLLHEPAAQQELGKFARDINHLNVLMCWIDIEEYKSARCFEHRRHCALKILYNYIKKCGPLHINVDEKDAELYLSAIKRSRSPVRHTPQTDGEEMSVGLYARPADRLDSALFQNLQKQCFVELYSNVFLPFKKATSYVDLRTGLKQKYNKVRPKDFDYFDVLGEGSFGVVVRCRKKSTGIMYAMKIMEKRLLSESAGWDVSSVDAEVRALSALRHPLIIGMDYSFQTERFAFIAMQLAPGGTLRSVSNMFEGSSMPEDYIRFYVAEVSMALHYLHCSGMIYRDMKPANVLIDLSGHVKLADLGGLVDYSESTTLRPISSKNSCTNTSYPFARSYALGQMDGCGDNLSEPVRRKTVFGTPGYASPEVMALLMPGSRFSKGYCYMTDWWSLGVTIFVMRTGRLPFGKDSDSDVMPEGCTEAQLSNSYKDLFDPIVYPQGNSALSLELQDLVKRFLTVDDTARLGYGATGLEDIQHHTFFEPLNWTDDIRLTAEPPFIPSAQSNKVGEPVLFSEICKRFMSPDQETDGSEQKVGEAPLGFENWDYISPTTLRIEFGIAHEMQQYDNAPKLQRLLGSDENSKKTTCSSGTGSPSGSSRTAGYGSNSAVLVSEARRILTGMA